MAKETKPNSSIGADPEFFVYDGKRVVPVCGLLNASKDNPRPVPFEALGLRPPKEYQGQFAYLEDNVTLEFNIPASSDTYEFYNYVSTMFRYCRNMLQNQGRTLSYKWADVEFKESELTHKDALTIGCDPDFQSLVGQGHRVRQPFDIAVLGRHRFAGGHIHMGYNEAEVPVHVMAKLLDLFLCLPLLKFDTQGKRREMYGLPGLFRPKPYGLEYRTLSNFWALPRFGEWLPKLAAIVLNLGEAALFDVDELAKIYQDTPWADVDRAIITEDKTLANDIVRWYSANAKREESALDIVKWRASEFNSLTQNMVTDVTGIPVSQAS